MTEPKQKIEPQPSTWFRKIVTGSSPMFKPALHILTVLMAIFLVATPPFSECATPSGSNTTPTQIQTARSSTESASLAELYKSAAHRKRRIILNNDGDDCLAPNKDGSKAVEQFLQQRTSPLVGSQVDAIFYCSVRCFGSVLHRSDVAENLATHSQGRYRDSLLNRLLDQGTDPLRVMVEFCHAKNIEVFCSMRMNDTHDAANPILRPRLKTEHPEYLLGPDAKRPTYGQWTAVDYGNPDVRSLAVRYIQEVFTRYDVDGVELDFFRHPVFFKTHADTGSVGDGERQLLTEMMHQIRALALSAGSRRGRPMLIAIRVPDSVDFCRAIGIDLERWLRESLMDILVTGGYFRLNPWDYSVRLGHQYGVPVYPALDFPVVVLDPRVPQREFSLDEKLSWVTATKDCQRDARRHSLEGWRARAAVAFNAEADGIYLFNMFTPSHPLLWEIGDPVSLLGKSKLYFVNWRGTRQPPSNYVPKGNTFFHQRPLNPLFPLEIKRTPLSVTLPVGAEATAGKRGDTQPKMTAELWIQPAESIKMVAITCNGQLLDSGTTAGDRLRFVLDPSLIKKGANVFVLRRTADGETQKVFLKDIMLQVAYPEGQ